MEKYARMMNNNKTIINECEAASSGAANTSVSGGGNSVSAMAPENSTACVVQGINNNKRKKPITSIAERIEARKARNAELSEAVEKNDINSYLRKRDLGERIIYSGSEEYEKQRKQWLSNKAKHDKTIENYYDGNPSRNPIGDLNMKNRYEDGQVDEFLAWYDDHVKEKKNDTKKMKESTSVRHRRLSENIAASDLFIFVPHNREVEDYLEREYNDVQGMVDDFNAWTLRSDVIRELLEDYEDVVDADIYECSPESEEPYFHVASENLEMIEDNFCFFEGDDF